MRTGRWLRVSGVVAALASLCCFAACQQVLGLDQSTVSVDAIGRICECVPLTKQGLAFAGSDTAACEEALAEQPDELLLAVAENDCTDCDNVTPCYAMLTEAGDVGDACNDSSGCASWACCQGVLSVKLVTDQDGVEAELVSTPAGATCCAECSACGDAFAALNTDTDVIACAEAEPRLFDLLTCLAEDLGDCECGGPGGVTPECLSCVANRPTAAERCAAAFEACESDLARPIPVQQ